MGVELGAGGTGVAVGEGSATCQGHGSRSPASNNSMAARAARTARGRRTRPSRPGTGAATGPSSRQRRTVLPRAMTSPSCSVVRPSKGSPLTATAACKESVAACQPLSARWMMRCRGRTAASTSLRSQPASVPMVKWLRSTEARRPLGSCKAGMGRSIQATFIIRPVGPPCPFLSSRFVVGWRHFALHAP